MASRLQGSFWWGGGSRCPYFSTRLLPQTVQDRMKFCFEKELQFLVFVFGTFPEIQLASPHQNVM
jgi:hypothetical protein